jgi:multidrug efflux system membrane fusion protein
VALGALLAVPFVFGIGTSAKAAQGAPQSIPVGVTRIEPHEVQLWSQFSGRLNAVDFAEIRPEVSGRITDIRFKDGQIVKAGQVLLVIDPRPYEAALAKAKGDLASARANEALAKTELERGNGLIKANAIARSMYDQRVNAHQVAVANVAVAEATLRQAEVDVDHAYVKAPISGRISRPELTLGNLVQTAPNAPLLASIVSNDGIYADFEVDEQTYMNTVHARAETAAAEQQLPVEMTVQGAEDRSYKGTVYSFDNKIDTGSGTIRARAKFDNSDGSLVPGMFVSVRLGAGDHRNAITVPERAIVADLNKQFVYVVGKGDKAEVRQVKLGATTGGERIVLSGLKAGDQVIVDGVQHIALGVPVAVQSKIASR